MFDEMFLSKCEEYSGGESFGADEDDDLYKGVMSFMIIGLQSNIPYIVKTVPEKTMVGSWLKEELLNCLKMLQDCLFKVRGVVCDDHTTNVLAYRMLLTDLGKSPDDLCISLNGSTIYLFHDTVHLIKNIQNNLLNRKRFIFPEFHFDGFYDDVKLPAGEVSWHLLHKVHETDSCMQAHLKTAP